MNIGAAMVSLHRILLCDWLPEDISVVDYIILKNIEGALTTLPGARIVCPSLLMMQPDCCVPVCVLKDLRCFFGTEGIIIR